MEPSTSIVPPELRRGKTHLKEQGPGSPAAELKSHGSWNENRTLKHLSHTWFVFFCMSSFLKNETGLSVCLAVFMKLTYFLETLLPTCMHME